MPGAPPRLFLPDAWANAWVDALVSAGVQGVTTIENEYPFLSYIDEMGGPAGLASRGEVAVYTAGFPTPKLVSTLAQLARQSSAAFQHWGDADVGGLRIWWLLRSHLAYPLALVGTTASWGRSRVVIRRATAVRRGAAGSRETAQGAGEHRRR